MKKPVLALLLIGGAVVVGCAMPPETDENAVPAAVVTPKPVLPDFGEERRLKAYLTGYSFWDNTPPGSAAIARPVLHEQAGGTGTFDDPVTLAVGHRIEAGMQSLDYPEGTRFYLPELKKYAIVEDVCGDGDMPQLGPCHIGHQGHPWLDIYVGGDTVTPEAAEACMMQITALMTILINPKPGYEVLEGEIMQSNCSNIDQSI